MTAKNTCRTIAHFKRKSEEPTSKSGSSTKSWVRNPVLGIQQGNGRSCQIDHIRIYFLWAPPSPSWVTLIYVCIHMSIHPVYPYQRIYCGPSTYQVPFSNDPLKYKTFPSHQKSLVSRSSSNWLPRSLIRAFWIFLFSAYLSVCSIHKRWL